MKTKQSSGASGQFWTILGIYLFYVGLLTLNPFHLSLQPLQHWLALTSAERLQSLFIVRADDFVLNLLLFIPLGLLLNGRLKTASQSTPVKRMLQGLFLGALLSTSIELLQLFLGRTTSIMDILANSLGTGAGILLTRVFSFEPPEKHSALVPGLGWLFLTGLILFAHLMPAQLNNALNWDDEFRLRIGDEFTDSRPWTGDIYTAALYNRALRSREIRRLIRTPADSGTVQRRRYGCVSFYRFENAADTVRDLGPARLDLVREGIPGQPLDSAGIALRPGCSLTSRRPAIAFVNAVRETQELSIEALVRSRDPLQSGPARIITISGGRDERNVTLGQVENRIQFRVRTPLTGENGSKQALTAGPVPVNGELIHLTAVFSRGVQRLYVNGKPAGPAVMGISGYLPAAAGYGSGPAAAFLFMAGLFFPVPFIWIMLFGRPAAAAVISLLFIGGVQIFYISICGQPLDILYTAAALCATAGAAVTGAVLKTKKSGA